MWSDPATFLRLCEHFSLQSPFLLNFQKMCPGTFSDVWYFANSKCACRKVATLASSTMGITSKSDHLRHRIIKYFMERFLSINFEFCGHLKSAPKCGGRIVLSDILTSGRICPPVNKKHSLIIVVVSLLYPPLGIKWGLPV